MRTGGPAARVERRGCLAGSGQVAPRAMTRPAFGPRGSVVRAGPDELLPRLLAEVVLMDAPLLVECEKVVLRRADLDELHHGSLPASSADLLTPWAPRRGPRDAASGLRA